MAVDSQHALAPEVDVVCVACGETAAVEIASVSSVAAQVRLGREFHRARLRRSSRAALEERASFTHDYATRVLSCARCSHLYRSPRPTAGAVLAAYEGERYSPERLPQMVASQRALF